MKEFTAFLRIMITFAQPIFLLTYFCLSNGTVTTEWLSERLAVSLPYVCLIGSVLIFSTKNYPLLFQVSGNRFEWGFCLIGLVMLFLEVATRTDPDSILADCILLAGVVGWFVLSYFAVRFEGTAGVGTIILFGLAGGPLGFFTEFTNIMGSFLLCLLPVLIPLLLRSGGRGIRSWFRTDTAEVLESGK
jgi:hypothetical protein